MNSNLFIEKYLHRINFTDEVSADLITLKRIQKQHLLNVPFENLDIIRNKRIEFDKDKIWSKVVEKNRGGVCYELNGLLYYLLKDIGFDVRYIAAKVLEDGNEFDHVFLLVDLNSEYWLVDVGFGDNFLEPLKLITDEIQHDVKGNFQIKAVGSGWFQLRRLKNESDYSVEYTFNLQKRKLEDFRERCLYFETSSYSNFKNNSLCSIERENGRFSLTDDKLTITREGVKTIKSIKSKEEFLLNLQKIFGINI